MPGNMSSPAGLQTNTELAGRDLLGGNKRRFISVHYNILNLLFILNCNILYSNIVSIITYIYL